MFNVIRIVLEVAEVSQFRDYASGVHKSLNDSASCQNHEQQPNLKCLQEFLERIPIVAYIFPKVNQNRERRRETLKNISRKSGRERTAEKAYSHHNPY